MMSFKIQVTSSQSGRIGFLPRLHGRSAWSPEAAEDPRTFTSAAAADAYIKRNWETHGFIFSRNSVAIIEMPQPRDHAPILRKRAAALEKLAGQCAWDLRLAADELDRLTRDSAA